MSNSTFFKRLGYLGFWVFLAPVAGQGAAQDSAKTETEKLSPQKSAVQDIFAVRTWAPPVPTESAPLEENRPKRPQLPQLPFRFVGKISDPDKPMAFLLGRGDRIFSVSIGDVIGGTYLVEKHERGQLYFIYRPMKSRQSLFVGEAL